jgi:CheY-like chemotaxis protein
MPDLILLDMNMPRMNGLQALRSIKTDPQLSVIPVIMLSTSNSPAEVRQAYEAHVNCFVQKPTNLERSERLVRAIELFWMDFAVLPGASVGVNVTPGDKGLQVARTMTEAISRNVQVAGSITKVSAPVNSLRCEEHRRLIEDFAATVKELLDFHQQQFEAAIQGDPESNRFDLLIHLANEKKQEAKYAYLRHVDAHGCSNLDVITNHS